MNDQVTSAETSEILRLAEQCLALSGDFVELGCYRGDTSVLLGKMLQKCNNNCESASFTSKYGNPVENLSKTPPVSVENSRKTHQESVNNSCKTSANLSKTLCKNLWIYDSFAGLPEKTAEDNSGAGENFQKGELFVSKREVVDKLRRNGLKTINHLNSAVESNLTTSAIIVKKAWFDDLKPNDLPARIAFAFLDGDLYESIKTSLKLVTPRLEPRGIIIVHDYNNPELPGSARAVDEFLRIHPEFKLTQKHTLAILSL